uniref:Uncharacterized protein n=1 Tax=Arundo donax TaxID=35708 RepID=A0A0A9F1V1_ARUDO
MQLTKSLDTDRLLRLIRILQRHHTTIVHRFEHSLLPLEKILHSV